MAIVISIIFPSTISSVGYLLPADGNSHDFHARFYNPIWSRFQQRDPTGYPDGMNPYEFLGSNPMRYVDPTGQGVLTLIFNGDYSQSDAAFLRGFGMGFKGATYGPLQERSYERFRRTTEGIGNLAIIVGTFAKPTVTSELTVPARIVQRGFFEQIGRNIAARDIRSARQLFRESGIPTRNANRVIKSYELPTFRIDKSSIGRVEFRYFDDFNAKLTGRFSTPELIVNQTDRITRLALPDNAATRVGKVYIPEGTITLQGIIAPQLKMNPGLTGGARQSFIMGKLDRIVFEEFVP